jgi:hypothetical protein
MGNTRDFRPFTGGRRPPEFGGNIPIIGSQPPAQIRDQFGRVLEVGDFVEVRTPHREPYRVTAVAPAPAQPGMPPNMMIVTLASTIQFLAQRDAADSTFLRVITKAEVEELGQRRQASEEPATPVAIGGEAVPDAAEPAPIAEPHESER